MSSTGDRLAKFHTERYLVVLPLLAAITNWWHSDWWGTGAATFILGAGMLLWFAVARLPRVPRVARTLLAVSAIAFAAVSFVTLYFAIFLASAYPSQHFRVTGESRIGIEIRERYAAEYLRKQRIDLVSVRPGAGDGRTSVLNVKDLNWIVKKHFMAMFSGPATELSEQPNPVKLDEYVHQLSDEEAEVYRFYDGKIEGTLSYSGQLVGLATVEAFGQSDFDSAKVANEDFVRAEV